MGSAAAHIGSFAEEIQVIPYAEARKLVFGIDVAPLKEGALLLNFNCTPIAGERTLYILGDGSEAEALAAQLFSDAWLQIPHDAREVALKVWKEIPRTHRRQEWAPEIILSEAYFRSGDLNDAKNVGNEVLWFRMSRCGIAHADECKARFAHEVGHSYVKGVGLENLQHLVGGLQVAKTELPNESSFLTSIIKTGMSPDELADYQESIEEKVVSELLSKWGFDPSIID